MNTNIDVLKEITPRLQVKREANNYIEYSASPGTCIGFGLYKNTTVAVQRVFMSKGVEIPEHDHPETEYSVVVSGSYELYYKGESLILGERDFITIEANEAHSARVLEDTWAITITIPASEEFPDA